MRLCTGMSAACAGTPNTTHAVIASTAERLMSNPFIRTGIIAREIYGRLTIPGRRRQWRRVTPSSVLQAMSACSGAFFPDRRKMHDGSHRGFHVLHADPL